MPLIMPCREATSALTDYREGRLKGFEKAKFEFHLKVCAKCSAYRDQFNATVEALGKLPRETPPEDLEAKLWAELEQQSKK